jgi:hypothetical protein
MKVKDGDGGGRWWRFEDREDEVGMRSWSMEIEDGR